MKQTIKNFNATLYGNVMLSAETQQLNLATPAAYTVAAQTRLIRMRQGNLSPRRFAEVKAEAEHIARSRKASAVTLECLSIAAQRVGRRRQLNIN